jgi:hypothetical protein
MEIAVNYLAVLACAVVAMVLGFMWYGPLLGKQWRHEMGFSLDDMKNMKMSPSMAYGLMAVGSLIFAYVLAHMLGISKLAFGGLDLAMALQGGFWLWLGFVATTQFGVVLWEGKSWKLFFINTSYSLVSMLAMASIIALWPPVV